MNEKQTLLPESHALRQNSSHNLKSYIWNVFEQDQATTLGKLVNMTLLFLIFLSVLSFLFLSDERLLKREPWLGWVLFGIEYGSVLVFVLEYLCKLYSCVCEESPFGRYGSIYGRIRFIISFSSLIDLVSIIPSFVSFGLFIAHTSGGYGRKHGIAGISMELAPIRLLRIVRLFKGEKYIHSWKFVVRVFQSARYEMVTAFFLIFVLTVLLSLALYIFETEIYVDPKTGLRGNPDFKSIPYSLFWVWLTATEVGAEVYPKTLGGKIVMCLCAMVAISAFQIPASIIASGFVEEVQRRRKQLKKKKKLENKEQEPTTLGINMVPDSLKQGIKSIGQAFTLDTADLPELDSDDESTNTNGSISFSNKGCTYTCPHCQHQSSILLSVGNSK